MRAVIVESRGAEARLDEAAGEDILSGAVQLDVLYSSYNYKDGMAITGTGRGVLQSWPIIPGIDIVGTVTGSADPSWSTGDTVVLNGDGIGESLNGGFATRARVRPEALVKLPEAISPQRAAATGTAGFTAIISVLQLADAGLTPDCGDVLVTGANSVHARRELRQRAWDALAEELDLDALDGMTTTIGLAETIPYAEQILAGRTRGRTVVDVNG